MECGGAPPLSRSPERRPMRPGEARLAQEKAGAHFHIPHSAPCHLHVALISWGMD